MRIMPNYEYQVYEDETMSMDSTECDEEMDDMEELYGTFSHSEKSWTQKNDTMSTGTMPCYVYLLNSFDPTSLGAHDGERRIGNEINMKRLYLQDAMSGDPSYDKHWSCYVVVYDRQPTATQTILWQDVFAAGIGEAGAYAFRNPRTMDRFEVIWMEIQMNVYGNSPYGYRPYFNECLDLKNLKTVFAPGTSTITTGALYLMCNWTNSIDDYRPTIYTRIVYEE
jgi:hypothetical protein